MEQVQAIWKARAKRFDSVLVKWRETRTHPHDVDERKGKPENAEQQREHIAIATIPTFDSLLLLDGTRARYETRLLSIASRTYPTSVSAFDGSLSRLLIEDSRGGGIIARATELDEFRSVSLKPILTLYRTLAPDVLYWRSYTMEMSGSHEPVDGVSCQRVQIISRDNGQVATVWFDNSREALPLRCKIVSSMKITCDVHIRYDEHSVDRMTPREWEVSFTTEDGKILESERATGISVAERPAVQENDFKIMFPRGTVVIDKRGGKPMKMVSEGNDLLRPYTPSDARGTSANWLWPILAIALLAIVVGAVYRWRLRS